MPGIRLGDLPNGWLLASLELEEGVLSATFFENGPLKTFQVPGALAVFTFVRRCQWSSDVP